MMPTGLNPVQMWILLLIEFLLVTPVFFPLNVLYAWRSYFLPYNFLLYYFIFVVGIFYDTLHKYIFVTY